MKWCMVGKKKPSVVSNHRWLAMKENKIQKQQFKQQHPNTLQWKIARSKHDFLFYSTSTTLYLTKYKQVKYRKAYKCNFETQRLKIMTNCYHQWFCGTVNTPQYRVMVAPQFNNPKPSNPNVVAQEKLKKGKPGGWTKIYS